MKIEMSLDTASIESAIKRLDSERFKYQVGELVDILCVEGSGQAIQAYGGMAFAFGVRDSENGGMVKAHIESSADNSDVALIAEFGAGDATVKPAEYFETHELDGIVFAGAYSLLHKQQYWLMGRWEFPPKSGNWMTEVQPRLGLYKAKEFIKQNSTRVAKEVIRFD